MLSLLLISHVHNLNWPPPTLFYFPSNNLNSSKPFSDSSPPRSCLASPSLPSFLSPPSRSHQSCHCPRKSPMSWPHFLAHLAYTFSFLKLYFISSHLLNKYISRLRGTVSDCATRVSYAFLYVPLIFNMCSSITFATLNYSDLLTSLSLSLDCKFPRLQVPCNTAALSTLPGCF